MDVINDRIIDVGLNVIGYLIAGGLGMLMHSALRSRRLRVAAVSEAAAAAESAERRTQAAVESGRNIEFVSFGTEAPGVAPADAEVTPRPNSAHRNRREIIRLAREMLQSGTTGEQIRRTLPISQSELSLLKNASSN